MIRVAIVDDHHAVRLGLHTALRGEPGLLPVGCAGSAAELAPLLYRTQPDVVLLDYRLPGDDGLTVCRELKAQALAPRVLLYSAFADDALTVPAIVAGADALLDKGVPARELFEAIRRVHAGATMLPPISAAQLAAAGSALEPDDLPILGMLIDRTPARDIAGVLGLDLVALRERIARMLNDLRAPVRRSTPQGFT